MYRRRGQRVPQRGKCPAASNRFRRPAERGRGARRRSRQPEDELFVYNWTEYIGEDVVPSFEEKYGVKVTYDFFSNTDEAYAKLGDDGGGYDVSFPISVDIPDFIDRGAVIELDKSLIPNIANLGAEWADPGYDPGNAHSVPVHVVDDRRRLRHLEDQGRS